MKTENSTTRNFCDETESLIDDFLEGSISQRDKELMEAHIDSCDNCRKYLDETSKLMLQLGSLAGNYEFLSAAERERAWKELESRTEFRNAPGPTAGISGHADPAYSKYEFIYRHKYLFGGIAAVLVLSVIYFAVQNLRIQTPVVTKEDVFGFPSYWKVSSLSGTPFISDEAMAKLDSIRDGQYIVTNDTSRAELMIADIGKVIIEPNTKLMIVKGQDGKNKLSVVYGTIDADMKQGPASVPVELPSATANDISGSYKLTVDNTGDGLFYVRSGKVEVTSGEKVSVVPAGSMVMTKRDKGVGTPFNAASSPVLKKALFDFDFGTCDNACISAIMSNATASDVVTLVNLIPKVEDDIRNQVYTRAVAFAPPPPGVPRTDSIPFLNEEQMENWINKINTEVQIQLDKNMKHLEANMKHLEQNLENLKELENMSLDTIVWMDNLDKNLKIKIKTFPGDFDFQYMPDSVNVYFDKEEFKNEMEELQRELKEDKIERKEMLNQEMKELQREMKELQEDLKDQNLERNEELRIEMEKARQEVEKAIKEAQKSFRFETYEDGDGKVKVEVKTENPEPPEPPEKPEAK